MLLETRMAREVSLAPSGPTFAKPNVVQICFLQI
jgi:hypothetical protein